MKQLLIILLVLYTSLSQAQVTVPYQVADIPAMKTYFGSANRIHVVSTNEDYVDCPTCTTDESTVYLGTGGRKWLKAYLGSMPYLSHSNKFTGIDSFNILRVIAPHTIAGLDVVYKQHLDSLLANITGIPSQSGQSGKYLTTNGTTTSWATVSGAGGGDVFLANANVFTNNNTINSSNNNPLSINGSGSISYLKMNSITGTPNVGMTFQYNGIDKWIVKSTLNLFTIYNNSLAANAFTIDSLTNTATFFGPAVTSAAHTLGALEYVYKQRLDTLLAGIFPSQTGNNGKLLSTNGTSVSWVSAPITGVTSVGVSVPSGFSVSGSPITSTGTIAITTSMSNGIVRVNSGGFTSGTIDTTDITGFSNKIRLLLNSGTGIGYNSSTGVFSNSGVLTVNGNTGAITIDSGYITNFSGKVRSLHGAGTGLSYNSSNGVFTNTGVLTVNGSTGAITIDTTSITNFYLKSRALLSATGPLTYSNTTGVFGITQASSTIAGYLSATDWTTFNNKASLASPVFTGNPTVPNQTPRDSSLRIANTAYADAAAYRASTTTLGLPDTIQVVGGGISPFKSVTGQLFKYRSFGTGFSLQGDSLILGTSAGGGDVYQANNNSFTGTNTFSNAAIALTVTRSTDGAASKHGTSSNWITLGNNTLFSQPEIVSSGRLDLVTGNGAGNSSIFLFGNYIQGKGHYVSNARLNSTSTLTQSGGWDVAIQNGLWNGSVNYYRLNGMSSRASTTTNGASRLAFIMTAGASGNANLDDGNDYFGINSDGTITAPQWATGTADSVLIGTSATGQLKKYAPAHSRSGTPTFTMTGGGTSPTITVTGNDIGGTITIVTGGSGSFAVLAGTLTFATAYASTPAVSFTPSNPNIATLGLWGVGASASTGSAGTTTTLAASQTYKLTYVVPQ